MKPISDQQLKDHTSASVRGAIEGTAVGTAIAGAGHYYFRKSWPAYRTLPPSLKALAASIIIVPMFSIQAERRGLEYEKSQWTGIGKETLDAEDAKAEAAWEALPFKQKIGNWAERHQYSMILGSWALSMAVAGAIISRDKYQTIPQKVVQARMWAQGLTIGVLIAAGALTSQKRAEAAKHKNVDHSWAEVLEKQQDAEREDAKEVKVKLVDERRSNYNVPI